MAMAQLDETKLHQFAGRMLGDMAAALGGGFTRFCRATATPFNLVLEARP